ncbi:MAG: hypothetical protein V7K47_23700 [Nostoc sp.]
MGRSHPQVIKLHSHIPKHLLNRVQELEGEKAAVRVITNAHTQLNNPYQLRYGGQN